MAELAGRVLKNYNGYYYVKVDGAEQDKAEIRRRAALYLQGQGQDEEKPLFAGDGRYCEL